MQDNIQNIALAERRLHLLRFARDVAHWLLDGRRGPPPPRPSIGGRYGGAFVTFYAGKLLRGCVGAFTPTDDAAAAIEDVTAASLTDPRFESDPIVLAELAGLTIEISLLTPPVPAPDPLALVPGVHGIIIRRGLQAGCFLPKVAIERGWSPMEFLSHCCTTKAGLPADAWRDDATQVHFFTAEVFSESVGT